MSADGTIELTPVDRGMFRFAFFLKDGTDLEFRKVELRIPIFAAVKPQSYQAAII